MLENKGQTYENGDISSCAIWQNYNPGKKCGIIIENIVDSVNSPYIGKWTWVCYSIDNFPISINLKRLDWNTNLQFSNTSELSTSLTHKLCKKSFKLVIHISYINTNTIFRCTMSFLWYGTVYPRSNSVEITTDDVHKGNLRECLLYLRTRLNISRLPQSCKDKSLFKWLWAMDDLRTLARSKSQQKL